MTAETLSIDVEITSTPRLAQFDQNNIVFGQVYTDHMLIADYVDGAWQKPQIVPYGEISFGPGMAAIHYGQAIFEGMKAFKSASGDVMLFRPEKNHERFNISAERMCMPAVPKEIFIDGLEELMRIDAGWVPRGEDLSLYLRPFMFSTDNYLGVRPSETYRFMIICSPAGKYYANPPKVKVEKQFIRAASGGVGAAKCAGNYAASLYPAKMAQKAGYDQLLWTDAAEHKYFEESGTMNVMFFINGKLITPALSDTILKGVTRDSVLAIARHWGIEIEERKVAIDEIIAGIADGSVTEIFGVGTAVVISPFSLIGYDGTDYPLPVLSADSFCVRAKDFLSNIRTGDVADPFGWVDKV
jgi:branched-chain amino acid aminotransferase